MKNGLCRVLGTFVTISIFAPLLLSAQGTAFTYQGRLSDGANAANGNYDLRFTIYDSTNLPGVVIAGPLTNSATAVSNGLFTVALDFGAGVFTGPDRWLEIGVRTNGAAAFTALTTRQLMAPTPYAINAANLGGALHVDANNTNGAPNIIAGSVLNEVDPGVIGAVIGGGGVTNYFGNVYSNRVAGDFSVVGGGFGNVNLSVASVIGGGVINQIQSGGSYSGIGSGGNNLIEAGTDQSFIGGGYGNSIRSHARSSTIGGGESNSGGAAYSVIAGGQHNLIQPTADASSIGGGVNNMIQSNATIAVIAGGHDNVNQSASFAAIGGGGYNVIQLNAIDSVIGGGGYNTIQTNANGAVIGGGYYHTIGAGSTAATINGGYNDSIGPASLGALIGGGYNNTIQSNCVDSILLGGYNNLIQSDSVENVIVGGHDSVIQPAASFAFIGAGGYQQIQSNAYDSAIIAGGYNTIQTNANGSFIGGGYSHTIQNDSSYSFIGGGVQNTLGTNAQYSFIGGGFQNTIQFYDNYSAIGGGGANTIQGNSPYSTIAGGINHTIQTNSYASTIGGGNANTVQSNSIYGTIPGGYLNIVAGPYGFAAGQQAQALHQGSFVWADSQNAAFASTISNQFNVRAQNGARFVTGGAGVTVDGQPLLSIGSATLGLTIQQNSSGAPNVIEGSQYNSVSGGVVGATIGGGGATNYLGGILTNSVAGNFDTVSGGGGNMAGGTASVIGGGMGNTNQADYSSVGGGFHNRIQSSAMDSTIGGGSGNQAGGFAAIVGGGANNIASVDTATVAGGAGNQATGLSATIPGGATNVAGGKYSFAAGQQAQALHQGSLVWADSQNAVFASTANDQFNVRAQGGVNLVTSGGGLSLDGQLRLNSAGGYAQSSAGNFSIDAPFNPGGRFEVLTNGNVGIGTGNPGATLHVYTASNPAIIRIQSTGTPGFGRIEFQSNPQGDVNEWRPAYIQSLDGGSFTGGLGFYLNGSGVGTRFGTNEVMRLINGNVGIGTNNPTQRLHVNGNILASGTITGSSDRNVKENFKPIDASEVLDKVTALPITRWSYKADVGVTHLGPMAQDFYAAFDIGMDDKHISMVDADGVALAAIQGLNEKVEGGRMKEEGRMQKLEEENAELKARLEKLERLMETKMAKAE